MPLLLAVGLGLLLTPAAAWLGRAWGLVDRPSPDALKIHERAIPVLGGAAVVASVFAALVLVGAPPSGGFLGAVVLALGVGIVDDIRPLPPWARLILLAAAGGVAAAGGIVVSPLGPLAPAAMVALVLVCTNAVNLLDGQDGLAGGLAGIAGLGFAALLAAGQGAAPALALSGSLAGFVRWNLPPARIFLGNGGAYAVGTFLAILAAKATAHFGWWGIGAAAICLGVFAFEMVFTVARRVRSHERLTSGDRGHSYDLLTTPGCGRLRVTVTFWGLGALAAALGWLAANGAAPAWTSALAAGVVAGFSWARLWPQLAT